MGASSGRSRKRMPDCRCLFGHLGDEGLSKLSGIAVSRNWQRGRPGLVTMPIACANQLDLQS